MGTSTDSSGRICSRRQETGARAPNGQLEWGLAANWTGAGSGPPLA